MDVKEFLRLKEELEDRKSALARLQGKRETLLQRLQEEYQCTGVGDATKLLLKKQKQLQKLEKDYQMEYENFQDEFGNKLAS